MVYRGRIDHGVIIWEGDARPPDGAIVRVEPIEPNPGAGKLGSIYRIAELAVPTGIPDLSVNVDHYLYGHPKVDDVQP
jgi:hypothetical protein